MLFTKIPSRRRVTYSIAYALLACMLGIVLSVAHISAHAKTPTSTSAPAIKLAEGEELAHPVVTGPFGPWKEVSVVLVEITPRGNFQFKGWIETTDDNGKRVTYDLPIPEEIGAVMEQFPKAVMFRRLNKSQHRAMIVLYDFHRLGSTTDDGSAAYVFRWDGGQIVADETTEKKLFGVKNAAQADKRLAKATDQRIKR